MMVGWSRLTVAVVGRGEVWRVGVVGAREFALACDGRITFLFDSGRMV